MGQYWKPVNLDKKEYLNPNEFGCGAKLWDQIGTHPGISAALIVLLAAQPERRGGGDFDMDDNWHGPEREFPKHNITPGPMPEMYSEIAKRTIGRWAGNRIALIGDYAQPGDIQDPPEGICVSMIWDSCQEDSSTWKDISKDVKKVIEHELNGVFIEGNYGLIFWKPRDEVKR